MLTNAMRVLQLFSFTRTELGVVETAELLGKPKSTISRWLSAMEAAGLLDRDRDSGRYRISMYLAALGEVARRATPIQRLARPILERLAAATGETSDLACLVGTAAMNIEVVESPRPIMHAGWVGRRLPLHATAAGKALLAWREPASVEQLLEPPFEQFTAWTISDHEDFSAELARVRSHGYAIAWAEMEPDLVAAAAPVRDHRGAVVAALAVTVPISRVTRESLAGIGRQVRDAADELSSKLGFR